MRLVAGVTTASGLLLAGSGLAAWALPAGKTAPVLDVSAPIVAFYAGTAEVDGSTTIEPTTTGTRSRLDCTILFAKDSDVLRPGAKDKLRRLADQLRAQGAGRLQVTGFTDDLGSAAHGLDLSRRRAHRVATELAKVLPARTYPMTIRGLGEAHPAVPNTSEANRRRNRRVTVTLTRAAESPAGHPSSPAQTPSPSPPSTPVPSATPTDPRTPEPTASPTASATAAPPPPGGPGGSGQDTPAMPASPASGPPWPLISGFGAALVLAGVLADAARRRRHTPSRTVAAAADTPGGFGAGGRGADTVSGVDPTPRTPAPPDAAGRPGVNTPPVSGAALTTTSLAEADDHRTGQEAAESTGTGSAASSNRDHHVPGAAVAKTAPKDVGPATPAIAGTVRAGSRLEDRLAAELAAWHSTDTHQPRLTLLGPVHVRTRGQALARRRPFYTELLAYLVLHPRGVTVDQIGDAFSLTPARVRTDMKILRDWLGADPATGRAYLPDARTTPAALLRGNAVYQLDGVLDDWQLFQRLTAATPDAGTLTSDGGKDHDRAERWTDALGLVTGQPFDQTRPAGWGWLFEGERVDLQATLAVTQTAVDLAAWHHDRGNDTGEAEARQVLALVAPAEADDLDDLDGADDTGAMNDRRCGAHVPGRARGGSSRP